MFCKQKCILLLIIIVFIITFGNGQEKKLTSAELDKFLADIPGHIDKLSKAIADHVKKLNSKDANDAKVIKACNEVVKHLKKMKTDKEKIVKEWKAEKKKTDQKVVDKYVKRCMDIMNAFAADVKKYKEVLFPADKNQKF